MHILAEARGQPWLLFMTHIVHFYFIFEAGFLTGLELIEQARVDGLRVQGIYLSCTLLVLEITSACLYAQSFKNACTWDQIRFSSLKRKHLTSAPRMRARIARTDLHSTQLPNTLIGTYGHFLVRISRLLLMRAIVSSETKAGMNKYQKGLDDLLLSM